MNIVSLSIFFHLFLQKTKQSKKSKPESSVKSSSSVSADPAKLKESADMVVKYLTPYFKDGKIASKVGQYQGLRYLSPFSRIATFF